MPLTLAEVEASLGRALGEVLRYPQKSPDLNISQAIEDLLRFQPDPDSGFSPRSADGIEIMDVKRRKSRRIVIRGLIDFLGKKENCYLDLFEGEFLVSAGYDGLEWYALRIGRRDCDGPKRSDHNRRALLAELGQMETTDWAYVFEKDEG